VSAADGAGEPKATAGADGERRRLTINDIARVANVSKKTVSRVINASPFVKEDTRERVNAVIAELGFEPDAQARGLAFRRSFLIGLIYDNPNPQYVIDMQQGILDAVRGSGYELVVHPCDRTSPSFLADARAFVERQRLFGVVMPPSVSEDERLNALLLEIECPYVRIASVPLDRPEAMIVTHDSRGAAEAARHLAELGHQRIGFISGPPLFRSSHERRRGFAEGLRERGLELSGDYDRAGAYTFDSGLARGAELLALPNRPTAIFAGNDEMAAGVYRAARDAGLDIPGDLSVVGFDDSPLASRVWPPLSSVRLPIRDMGRFAADTLMEGVLGPRHGATTSAERRVEPRLVVRASTAAPAA
jgi:LacI family transcriptional regulator